MSRLHVKSRGYMITIQKPKQLAPTQTLADFLKAWAKSDLNPTTIIAIRLYLS